MNRLYLSPPHLSGLEIEYVKEAFSSNWVAPLGPMVDAFEAEIRAYTGARHSVAVSSGTSAIHLSLMLLGVSPGDEVICQSFTFAGSAFPIRYLDATPIFVDSEKTSWNMDPELLRDAIVDRIKRGRIPKAVMVVHLYGQSADLDGIMEVCARYDIPVIEDAAESLGTLHRGTHTGTRAPLGVLSFNGNKIITTSGGGMLLCHNAELAARGKFLATQAREPVPWYEHREIGFNYRMSNILAAIGRGQLKTIEERVARRRAIFDRYSQQLGRIPGITFCPDPPWGRSNHWLTCIQIDSSLSGVTPEDIRLALERENIESRPLWKPMHLQPVFMKYPSYLSGFSEKVFRQGLCLPSGSSLSDDDLARVAQIVEKIVMAGKTEA
jgi:dTDP-4-amino-4,6-dideoxygalactose transaminase